MATLGPDGQPVSDEELARRTAKAENYYRQLAEAARGYDLSEGSYSGFRDDLLRHALYDVDDSDQVYQGLLARLPTMARPTASNGGVGGDADLNGDGQLDAGQSGGGWFASNMPDGGGGGFSETYTAPERPAWLQGPYVAPTWNETFTAPTAESLTSDPGYVARMNATQRGFERSAAAKGSVLSGGFVGRTLPRALGEQASQEYANAFGRAFDTYRQRYGQFTDAASMGAQARSLNENAFQSDVSNSLNAYNTRYRAYQDWVLNNLDAARLGLSATQSGAPA